MSCSVVCCSVSQLLSQAVQGVLLLAALLLPTIALGVQPGGLSAHVFQFQSQALPLFGERFLTLSEFVLSACQRLGGDAGGFQFRSPRFDRIDLPLEFTGSVVQLDLLLAEPQAGIALLVILLCRACIQGGFLSRQIVLSDTEVFRQLGCLLLQLVGGQCLAFARACE